MLDNANCQAKGICWAVQMAKHQEGYHDVVIEGDAKWWFYFIY